MDEDAANRNYCAYLCGRSVTGYLYRRFSLYPALCRRLRGRALDVGCGIGDFLKFRPNTIGLDINPYIVDYCRNRGLDARQISPDGRFDFPEAFFDSAVMDNVLEHISDPGPVLSEVLRVLSPGGVFLVGVPGERGYGVDPDHKHHYTEAGLAACLAGAGFTVMEIFHMPWRCDRLATRLRQYCRYAAARAPQDRVAPGTTWKLEERTGCP